jgi:hypothetical protein
MTFDDRLTEQARALRGDLVNVETAVAGLAAGVEVLAERTEQSQRTVARLRRVTIGLVACFAAGLLVAAYLVVINRQLHAFSRCQAAVNEVMVVRSRALTEATADERAAERHAMDVLFVLLRELATTPADERTDEDRKRLAAVVAEILKAGATLETERAKADQARRENPPPPPPSQTCQL